MKSKTAHWLCGLTAAVVSMAGCGLKGDLYLPEEEPGTEQPAGEEVDMNQTLEELPQDQPEENTQENPGPDQ